METETEMEMEKTGICRIGILYIMTLFLCVLLRTSPAEAASIPEGSYTPEGSSLTYTFTGDSTAPNGFVANVESYRSSAIVNGELKIDRTIQYKPKNSSQTLTVNVGGILRGVFSGCTSMTSLILPDTLTYIGQEAFSNCTGLRSIRTDSGAFSYNGAVAAGRIERRAFYGCSALSGVALGEQLSGGSSGQTIQEEAFMNCTSLTSVEVGPAVSWIAGGAFANCANLDGLSNGIKIRDNAVFFVQDGILYFRESSRSNVLLCCPAGTPIGLLAEFPENVTQIKDKAFYGCVGLASIEVPDTVRSIGEEAFYNCISLGNVIIPNSVTNIGTQAFGGCSQGLCIICSKGSVAENYADTHKITKSMECTVTFFNTITQETIVKTVMSGETVDPPLGWERNGYVLRWSDNFNSNTVIESNRTISTVWSKLYTVTFRDNNSGREHVVEGVEQGREAVPPDWTREGYDLTWSTQSYKNVTADMIVTAIWVVSWTNNQPGDSEEIQYKVGDLVTIDNIIYKISSTSPLKVRVMGLEDETVSKVTVPDTVVFGGKEYQVTCINASAFRENLFLTKVTLGSYVRSIENRAFYKCANLKTVVINSSNIVNFGNLAFKKTSASMKVYVPKKSLIKTYETGMLDAGLSKKASFVLK